MKSLDMECLDSQADCPVQNSKFTPYLCFPQHTILSTFTAEIRKMFGYDDPARLWFGEHGQRMKCGGKHQGFIMIVGMLTSRNLGILCLPSSPNR